MKKIIINICFILIALTAVASVCACDADNCTEEVDLSGNNVENNGPAIDIGSPIDFFVENTDGCHWVVSRCTGAEFAYEYSYGSVTEFNFYATSRVGIVQMDLVNSNGEVIDTRVTEWDAYIDEYEEW